MTKYYNINCEEFAILIYVNWKMGLPLFNGEKIMLVMVSLLLKFKNNLGSFRFYKNLLMLFGLFLIDDLLMIIEN